MQRKRIHVLLIDTSEAMDGEDHRLSIKFALRYAEMFYQYRDSLE
jgi:hypothetical protein